MAVGVKENTAVVRRCSGVSSAEKIGGSQILFILEAYNKRMHQSYEKRLKHPADFRVKYTFYTKEEGGRERLPHQGIRSDFWYDHPDHKKNYLFMIWPEFEDENGNVIEEYQGPAPRTGTARMWIIIPERRDYHRDKIKIGTIGYFREGTIATAICEVIEIIGLPTNPTTGR